MAEMVTIHEEDLVESVADALWAIWEPLEEAG